MPRNLIQLKNGIYVVRAFNEDHKVFIEKAKTDSRGQFISSILISPVCREEIHELILYHSHNLSSDKLCFDTAGWPYDSRYCAICNTFLGSI